MEQSVADVQVGPGGATMDSAIVSYNYLREQSLPTLVLKEDFLIVF